MKSDAIFGNLCFAIDWILIPAPLKNHKNMALINLSINKQLLVIDI